jgi:O-antigen/teichoic acid export membrane protein
MASPLQLITVSSTFVIFLLSAILAAYLLRRYAKRKKDKNYLFWSIGVWVFAISALLETLFALNVYNVFLMEAYLFLVVLLVELLGLGSIQLTKFAAVRRTYYVFFVITLAATLYSVYTTKPRDLVANYVVALPPPLFVTITSTVGTTVAAAVILIMAAMGYRRTKNRKLLSIIAGVVVVSIAGFLYIAAFPVLLYYAEFLGILLLWLGFF